MVYELMFGDVHALENWHRKSHDLYRAEEIRRTLNTRKQSLYLPGKYIFIMYFSHYLIPANAKICQCENKIKWKLEAWFKSHHNINTASICQPKLFLCNPINW